VELHDKSGKKLRKGQGVCIIDSDISCDFDEGRPARAAAAAPVAATSRFTLSEFELKEVARPDEEVSKSCASAHAASLFAGTGKRIKGSSGPLAPSEAGGCSATESTGPSRIADQPAVCWKMQFHWYDGQQDRVRNSSASVGSRTSSASSVEGPSRTNSGGSAASDGSEDLFSGVGHSLKGKRP
jgi:hypothetical protein